MDINFMKNNNLDLKINSEQKHAYSKKIPLDFSEAVVDILTLEDEENIKLQFKKYWNSFIHSDTPKTYFTLDEFLERMKDEEYLKSAINKMSFQKQIVSCQYIKDDKKIAGFANYFFVYLPKSQGLCCHSNYYFIYKNEFNKVEDVKVEIFVPSRETYKLFNIEPNALDCLAKFSIPINKGDKIYCLKCKKVLERDEILQN